MSTPSTLAQAKTIGWMRWRTFINSVQSTREWLDVVAKGLVGLFIVGWAIGPGIAIGFAGYLAASGGKYGSVALALWGIFLAWQFLPLLVMMTSGGFQYKQLLRFPLHFRTFFLLTSAYGLLDPAAIIGVVWLGFFVAGITFGKAVLAPWALLVALVFGLMNLLLSVMVASWLERLLAKRKSREALLLVFFTLVFGIQLIGPLGERIADAIKGKDAGAQTWIDRGTSVVRALPPGMALRAVEGAARRDLPGAAQGMAGLAAYTALFGWVLAVRLRAQYRGEELSDAVGPAQIQKRAAKSEIRDSPAPWHERIPFLRGIPGVVVWKDALYLRRIPMMLMQLVIPLVMVGLIGMWSGRSENAGKDFAKIIPLAFPMITAYALLVQSAMFLNALGTEGKGIQFYLFAPVRIRDIMLGKNLTVSLVVVLIAMLALVLISAILGPPGIWIILSTLAWLAMALLGSCALGNILSLYYPRLIDMTKFKSRQSGVAALAAFAGQLVMLGIGAFGFMGAQLLGQPWLAVLFFALLATAVWVFFRLVMSKVDGIAMRQREVLCGELCKNL